MTWLSLVQQPVPARGAPQTPQAPAAPGTATLPTADLATLQAQLVEATIQQTGLRAQWDGLRRQLDNMLQTNPARPGVQQQWADVGVQLAEADGKVAALQARVAQKQGRPVGTSQTGSPPPRRDVNPELLAAGTFAVLLALVVPLSIARAIRMIKGNPRQSGPSKDEFTQRFDRIEHAVDVIAIEVERISEGQRFVTKILAEKPSMNGVQPPSVADGDRVLALGAGPVEPIRVNDRQAVHQSNKSI